MKGRRARNGTKKIRSPSMKMEAAQIYGDAYTVMVDLSSTITQMYIKQENVQMAKNVKTIIVPFFIMKRKKGSLQFFSQ